MTLILTEFSKGKFDYITALNSLLGPPISRSQTTPGKPLGFWKAADGPYVIALPGNPVSVMACASRYLIPALKQHLGYEYRNQRRTLAAEAPWKAPIPGFLPVRINDQGTLIPSPMQNSGDYLCLRAAVDLSLAQGAQQAFLKGPRWTTFPLPVHF